MNQEQREAHIQVLVNNAEFNIEVAYQLFDDLYKEDIYNFFEDKYREDLKQAWIDDLNPKEFFVGMLMSDIKVRNQFRTELEELVSQWIDEQ